MATQTLLLSGLVKWAKVFKENMDAKYGKYTLMFQPDKDSKALLKSSGSRVKAHEDEDGIWYKISRDHEKTFEKSGETVTFGPPKVVAADNTTPFDQLIGNNSKVTLRVDVYDSQMGKGTRLQAVRVDELVPYEKGSDGERELYPF